MGAAASSAPRVVANAPTNVSVTSNSNSMIIHNTKTASPQAIVIVDDSVKPECKSGNNSPHNHNQQQQQAEHYFGGNNYIDFDDELCEESNILYDGVLLSNEDEEDAAYEDGYDGDDEFTQKRRREAAEALSHTAMSLDMDNDDLLFNLLYFNKEKTTDNNPISIDNIINNITTETIALHSEHNTPYKIKPLSNEATSTLIDKYISTVQSDVPESECLVCMEAMAKGDDVICLSDSCGHSFHKACLLKWFTLQSHCPVCRKEVTL